MERVATRSKSGVTLLLQTVDARLVFINIDLKLSESKGHSWSHSMVNCDSEIPCFCRALFNARLDR